jgi:chromosome segregation ATPase
VRRLGEEELAEVRAELEALQAQVADAEARAAHYREERDRAQAALREAQSRLAQLEEEVLSLGREVEALRGRLREAVLRYREARLAASPHVPPELVSGESIEEVDERFREAERIVSQLRRRLEEEAQSRPFPLGAPPRRPPDLSALSPLEKIRRGLRRL